MIQLIDGPYMGITYQYGRTTLKEGDGFVTLSFEYSIIHGDEPTDVDKFKTYIGDILVELIHQQLSTNDLIYVGGT
jgi:hypothetical protein